MVRHLLSLIDWQPREVEALLVRAEKIKSRPGDYGDRLRGKRLGLLFLKSSTRTRVSFEVGIGRLGGSAVFLSADDLQLGRGETLADTARVLSTFFDILMVRLFAHSDIEELARHCSVPVINGLTDDVHPCQALADLLTLHEEWGGFEARKLAYVGDGNNVAHSLMVGAAKVGLRMSLCSPPSHEVDRRYLEEAQRQALETGGEIVEVESPREVVSGADAVYTDTWISMGQEAERQQRLEDFAGFMVNEELLSKAADGAVFLHCLPCHRGEEVSAEVVDGPRSRVWRQVENRLYVQNAVMLELMES